MRDKKESMDNQRKNIFLIGFMGVGKSSVAQTLCKRLGMVRVEMDEEIVRQQDMAISDIFDEYGENYFRRLETDLLENIANNTLQVVSCGGGAVLKEKNVSIMKECGTIVLLTAEPETIYDRVKDDSSRPLLNGNMSIPYICELMEERQWRYEAAADVIVATDNKDVEEIVDKICRKLRLA